MGSLASRHVESSKTRDWEVPVPCIGRQSPLDHQGSPINWFLIHFDLYNHKLLFVSFGFKFQIHIDQVGLFVLISDLNNNKVLQCFSLSHTFSLPAPGLLDLLPGVRPMVVISKRKDGSFL